jgi:3'(2'), 5'-bisphosphate nucleotidase
MKLPSSLQDALLAPKLPAEKEKNRSMIDDTILRQFLESVRPLVLQAGDAIRRIADEPLDVQHKEDGSPLTRADLASHNILLKGLEALRPSFPVISEESSEPPAEARDLFWLVDPLDGTKEFVKRLGDYTVNVALVEDGQPVLGVVYAPALDVLYFAVRGGGAWKQIAAAEPKSIHADQVVRPRTAVVSLSHLSEETAAYLRRIGVEQTVPHGSAIKMCIVAEGQADIYPRHGPTHLWDTAAGTAVAREAGCKVLDLHGRDLTYELSADLLCPGFLVCPADMEIPWPE